MKKIIFWARQIGWPPSYTSCDEKTAQEVLEYAYEKWIRCYDTAPIYWLWRSEILLGKTFQKQRQDIEIITKFWFDWDENGKTFFDFTPQAIHTQLKKSLERLQTDFIDTYLLHIPPLVLNIEEILTTLNEIKSKGLIKNYGVCNMYFEQLQDFTHHPLSQVEYVEDFYNILEKKAEDMLFPYKKPSQKFLAYGPLYRGIMTSLSIRELLEKDEDAINRLIKNKNLPLLYKKKQLYEMIAKRNGVAIEKIALDFLKYNPHVYGIIFGTKNKEHLESFLHHFYS